MCEDESRIHAYQPLQATWFEKGKQKQVPTYGHHASVSLFGAVNVLSGEFLCQMAENCKVASFKAFLQHVLDFYEDRFVIMILDNSRIHHAKELQSFFEEQKERLMLIFFPPYSPNLNPVERMWKWLKQTVIYNRFHKDKESIASSINDFLVTIQDTPEQILKRINGIHMLDY